MALSSLSSCKGAASGRKARTSSRRPSPEPACWRRKAGWNCAAAAFGSRKSGSASPTRTALPQPKRGSWRGASTVRSGDHACWLCEFSNGDAFAAHLLLRHPDRFRGAALLSAPLVLPPWPAGALRGKPVFYAHGDTADTVVDPAFYAAAEFYLAGPAECAATFCRRPIGHAVTPEVVGELGAWSDALRRTPHATEWSG